MRRWCWEAADLVLGASCAGCGVPALQLCSICRAAIRPSLRLLDRPSTPAVAAGDYGGALRAAILAWKEHGRYGLEPVLAQLLAAAVAPHLEPSHAYALVPVPTSWRRRARGADVLDDLARATAVLLRRTGADVGFASALCFARRTQEQTRLGSFDRRLNLDGAFRIRSTRRWAAREVIVVDDVLTTGATASEAVRALTDAGRRPAGIAVLAAAWR